MVWADDPVDPYNAFIHRVAATSPKSRCRQAAALRQGIVHAELAAVAMEIMQFPAKEAFSEFEN